MINNKEILNSHSIRNFVYRKESNIRKIKNSIPSFSKSDYLFFLKKISNNNIQTEFFYKNLLFLNEYIYKNHSRRAVFGEFFANDTRADFLVVNGTTTVYEIKTKNDTLKKLEKQLNSYINIFDKIIVFISDDKKEKVLSLLSKKKEYQNIGVIFLDTKTKKIKNLKKPKSNLKNINFSKVLNTFSIKELNKIFGSSNIEYIIKNNKNIKREEINKIFVKTLKKRMKDNLYWKTFPDELKYLFFNLRNESLKFKKKLSLKLRETY